MSSRSTNDAKQTLCRAHTHMHAQREENEKEKYQNKYMFFQNESKNKMLHYTGIGWYCKAHTYTHGKEATAHNINSILFSWPVFNQHLLNDARLNMCAEATNKFR